MRVLSFIGEHVVDWPGQGVAVLAVAFSNEGRFSPFGPVKCLHLRHGSWTVLKAGFTPLVANCVGVKSGERRLISRMQRRLRSFFRGMIPGQSSSHGQS